MIFFLIRSTDNTLVLIGKMIQKLWKRLNKIKSIIIKKLNIKSGQKLLEIGCGWGGMAFEIARQKGCEVKGISLSKNQINYCKKKLKN